MKEGCPSCSFIADCFDGTPVHLARRDITLLAGSRAALPEIEAYKKRMGWRFQWVSSFGSDFNFDYQVSATKEALAGGKTCYNYDEDSRFTGEERPGAGVFYKNPAGEIFHTYSTYGRGLGRVLIGAYNWIDLAPKGRDEANVKPHPMAWVRRHDSFPNDSNSVLGIFALLY